MIKWIFLLSFTLLFLQNSNAQASETKPTSLLWKISGPKVKGDCYLFGTMHLIEKDHFYFPEKLENIAKKADFMVMEMSGLPDPMEAMPYLLLEEGSFFDFFTPEETDSIIVWVKEKLDMDEPLFRTAFAKMKPFTIVQMAIQVHFQGELESYEQTFFKLAEENKIKVEGLETLEQQMAIFDNLTDDQQAELLMESIREGDEGIDLIEKMQMTYVSQDIEALYTMMTEGDGIISEEQNAFLDDRNRNWIPLIKEYIRKKDILIAVGAGHLGGPNGVIKLLQAEGYTVTPIEL